MQNYSFERVFSDKVLHIFSVENERNYIIHLIKKKKKLKSKIF